MNVSSSSQSISGKVSVNKKSSSACHSTRHLQYPRSTLPRKQYVRKVSQQSAFTSQCHTKPTMIQRTFSPTSESQSLSSRLDSKVKESLQDSNEQFVQTIFTSLGELASKLQKLNEHLVLAECTLKTSKRLEKALSDRLVDSQRWESAHLALIKEKAKETSTLQQSYDTLEKENCITSRTIMERNHEIWEAQQRLFQYEKHVKQAQSSESEAKEVLPVLRLSCSNAVESVTTLENSLKEELQAQAHIETRLNLAAKDIFWICRLQDIRGSINQSLRVQLVPPGNSLPLHEDKTNQIVENSKSQQCLDTSHIISLVSTTTLSNKRCSPNPTTGSSWNPFREKILLVSGVPVFWLKLEKNIKQKEPSAIATLENCSFKPGVAVPYDRVIESDPAKRPHELLLTDWKHLDVPLSTNYEEHASLNNAPCIYPSLNEHEQITSLVSNLIEEFLNPIIDHTWAKPLVTGILCLGSKDTCNHETLHGNTKPSCVVKKPLIKAAHIEKGVFHECNLKVSVDDTNFSVEAAIIAEPQTSQNSPFVEGKLSDTAHTTSETHNTMTTNKSVQLSEKSLEFLRSLQSQSTLPGMGLHRDNRKNDDVSLSPKHTVNMFLEKTVDKVPRLNLSYTQNDRNINSTKQCLTVRSCHSARTFRTATTPPSVMKRCGTNLPEITPRDVYMTSLLNTFKPLFKVYSCAEDLLSEYTERVNGASDQLSQKHSLVIFQIKCKVFSTPLKSTVDVTLCVVAGGLTISDVNNISFQHKEMNFFCVEDSILAEFLTELLHFPKVDGTSANGSLAKLKKTRGNAFSTTSFNDDCVTADAGLAKQISLLKLLPLPQSSIAKAFRYLSLLILSNQLKLLNCAQFFKEQHAKTVECKGASIVILCNTLFPYLPSISDSSLFNAVATIIHMRSTDQNSS
ncbi:uncharacterized protein LOC128884331 isoform X2 [Hylaeus volcanicus]|uniref:uncharacterized protein LOC128884331 isoform X2 n=1 Tax=Hylaeus volcanicus TaxID=313075 RepID=UPI0023B87FE3|nr:uncharacterized protein LOC128884331 isoform X2 [Hylaeus volcanicus]